MTDSLTQALTDLADPTRRTVLQRLVHGPATVGQLAALFPVSRAAVSQHVRVLREAGLVRPTSANRLSPYELAAEPVLETEAWLRRLLEHLVGGAEVRRVAGPCGPTLRRRPGDAPRDLRRAEQPRPRAVRGVLRGRVRLAAPAVRGSGLPRGAGNSGRRGHRPHAVEATARRGRSPSSGSSRWRPPPPTSSHTAGLSWCRRSPSSASGVAVMSRTPPDC